MQTEPERDVNNNNNSSTGDSNEKDGASDQNGVSHEDDASKRPKPRSKPPIKYEGTLIAVDNATPAQEGMWKILHRQEKRRAAFKELFLHLIFTAVFITIVMLQRDVGDSYWMNNAFNAAFIGQPMPFNAQQFQKPYTGIQVYEDVRDYMRTLLAPTLENDVWYSGRPYAPGDSNYIQYYNRLVGGVRIRQLRVRNDSCTIPNNFQSVTNFCYSNDYSDSTRDISPFGPNDKYTYTSTNASIKLWGYVGGWYEGGGYITDIPLGGNATEIIDQLIADEWFDRATRVIFITMNFVNAQLDARGSVLYLMLEIPAAGVVAPSFVLKTFRLDLYVTGVDIFRGILEVVFVLFLVYWVNCEVREILQLKRKGEVWSYFYSLWNVLEIVNILAFTTSSIMYVRYLALPDRYGLNLSDTYYFYQFESVASDAVNMYNLSAFNILLCAFRAFKYLRLNDRLFVIWKALKYCSPELFSFLIIFFIMFLGFILMGWLTFGADTNYFNTFGNAWGSCWNFVLGNPPDDQILASSNRVLGPLFFTFFSVFVYFILANMFIAILNDAYDAIHVRPAGKTSVRKQIARKAKKAVASVKNTIRGRKMLSAKRLIEQMKDVRVLDQEVVTPEEMRQALGSGATEQQVKELLEIHAKLHSGNFDPAIFGDVQLSSLSSRSNLRGRPRRGSMHQSNSMSAFSGYEDGEDSVREELASLHRKIDSLSNLLASSRD